MSLDEYCYWECLLRNEAGDAIKDTWDGIKATALPLAINYFNFGYISSAIGTILTSKKIWDSPRGKALSDYIAAQLQALLVVVEA